MVLALPMARAAGRRRGSGVAVTAGAVLAALPMAAAQDPQEAEPQLERVPDGSISDGGEPAVEAEVKPDDENNETPAATTADPNAEALTVLLEAMKGSEEVAGGSGDSEKAPSEPEDLPAPAADAISTGEQATDEVQATTAAPPVTTAAPVATMDPPVEATLAPTKPALRGNDDSEGTVVKDSTTNESVGTVREYLNQGNPLILAGFAVICCFFLLLWSRKRRLASAGGSSGESAADKGSGTTSSSTKKIGSKVQYSRIDDQFQAESPFSRAHGDDDDYDDEEEDGFGQDRDKWDDWDPDDTPLTQGKASSSSAYAADPNPFASPVQSVHFPTASATASAAPAFKINPPPAQGRSGLHDVVLAPTGASPPATSVGSNSSSDSFEVVTDESAAAAAQYPLFPAPASKGSTKKAEEEKESVDDLFSVRTAALRLLLMMYCV